MFGVCGFRFLLVGFFAFCLVVVCYLVVFVLVACACVGDSL